MMMVLPTKTVLKVYFYVLNSISESWAQALEFEAQLSDLLFLKHNAFNRNLSVYAFMLLFEVTVKAVHYKQKYKLSS